MMDDLIEVIVEIFLEGAMEAAASNKVPKGIRILFSVILLVFFGCIFGAILCVGIRENSPLISSLAILLLLGFVLWILKKIKDTDSPNT